MKVFIGDENEIYKETQYSGKMYYFNETRNRRSGWNPGWNPGWSSNVLTCEEMQIKKLLE